MSRFAVVGSIDDQRIVGVTSWDGHYCCSTGHVSFPAAIEHTKAEIGRLMAEEVARGHAPGTVGATLGGEAA